MSLVENQLDDGCMQSLGEYIQDNQYLENLNLIQNRITDKGIEILSECLIGNTVLKRLDLQGNYDITNASTPCLVRIIKSSYVNHVYLGRYSKNIREIQEEIDTLLKIPVTKRAIPIKSNLKSATKVSATI